MWLILFILGAIYVLGVYFISEKKVHISCCVFPIVEIIGMFVMKGTFSDLCLILLGGKAGFSLWGWLMLILAAILALDIIYWCMEGQNTKANLNSNSSAHSEN